MSHRLFRILAAFTPAKLEAWCRLLVALSFVFLILLFVVLVLAVLLVWTLAELDKLGYGPGFFILLMKFLKPSI